MEFKEVGKYNPNALDYLTKVNPVDFAKLSPLRRLDFLLTMISKYKPDVISEYTKALINEYKEKTDYILLEEQSEIFDEMLDTFENLQKYPELAFYNFNYFLNVLELKEEDDWKGKEIKVPQGNFIRSFLLPKYVNLKVLTEVVDREYAIKLYKQYVTEFLIEVQKDTEGRHENLDDLATRFFDFKDDDESQSWVVHYSEPKNGKLFYRKEICLWNDALPDLPDLELKYLIYCYGDYQGIKRENKHFILTMEHTIVEGDPYCSCIVHDTRIDWNLKHPSKEFWDDVWPFYEWQKK